MSDGSGRTLPDGQYGAGEHVPSVAPSPDMPVFGNDRGNVDPNANGREPVEQGPAGIADPNAPAPVERQPVEGNGSVDAQPKPPQQELDENARNADRDDIIKRFKARRAEEAQEASQEAQPPQPDPTAQQPQQQPDPAAQPQPQAQSTYTLKIRGQNFSATREQAKELINYIDPDADLTGMSEKAIVNAAQLAAIAKINREEAAQARANAHQPQQAPTPQAPQQPAQQEPSSQAKSLAELRAAAVERTQFGTQDEANQAWEVYERERERAAFAQYDQTRQAQNAEAQIMADVNSWGARNADLVQENSPASRMLLMSAAHEMQDDLRSHGFSDRDLGEALNNPKLMTYLFTQARQNGLRVRSNTEILEAAGNYTRQALRMPTQGAPQAQPQGQAPQPSAMDARLDAKRSLPAQPTRSGNPQSIPVAEIPVERKRSDVIAKIAESRTRNNVAEFIR